MIDDVEIYYLIDVDYDVQNPNLIQQDLVDADDDDVGNFHFAFDEIFSLGNLI
jgi:hypothetical protein